MKALIFFYIIICLYASYYTCYMVYRVLGDDAIPLFVSFGMLFIIRCFLNYKKIKL